MRSDLSAGAAGDGPRARFPGGGRLGSSRSGLRSLSVMLRARPTACSNVTAGSTTVSQVGQRPESVRSDTRRPPAGCQCSTGSGSVPARPRPTVSGQLGAPRPAHAESGELRARGQPPARHCVAGPVTGQYGDPLRARCDGHGPRMPHEGEAIAFGSYLPRVAPRLARAALHARRRVSQSTRQARVRHQARCSYPGCRVAARRQEAGGRPSGGQWCPERRAGM